MMFRSVPTLELIGVVAEADGDKAAAAQGVVGPHRAVHAAGLAAVLCERRAAFWRTRANLGRELVAFQKGLETLHAVAPVLPAAPNQSLADDAEAEAFLRANAMTLRRGLVDFGVGEQHQITIDIPKEALLRRMADDPQAAARLAEARRLTATGDRRGAGAALANAAEAARERWGDRWLAQLSAVAQDTARLPHGQEDTALNLALLGPRGGAAAVETALEAIDADWRGALKIRLIGPSPASSFASLFVMRMNPETLSAAAARLAVEPGADADTVRAAYRRAMTALHPDVSGHDSAADAHAATEARDVLLQAAEAGGGEAPVAVLRREGDRVADARAAA